MERTSEYISRWREWVGTHPGAIVLDGGLGHTLVERGNDLNVGKLWSGRLVVVDHDEVRSSTSMISSLHFYLASQKSSNIIPQMSQ